MQQWVFIVVFTALLEALVLLASSGHAYSQVLQPTRATISIPNITAAAGDTVRVPILITQYVPVPQNSAEAQTRIFGFQTNISFNPNVVVILPDLVKQTSRPNTKITLGPIAGGVQTIDVEGTVRQLRPEFRETLRAGDTLAVIPIVVCLGNETTTTLDLGGLRSYFIWLDSLSAPIDVPLERFFNPPTLAPRDGVLTVTNARWYNLVNAASDDLTLTITPNPIDRSDATIDITAPVDALFATIFSQRRWELGIYSSTGKRESNLTSRLPVTFATTGKAKIALMKTDISSGAGVYYCRFTFGSATVTKMILVK